MSRQASFRVGRVQGYLRGKVWYLCYHEQGQRHRPRVGPDRKAAKQLAAQIHAQLETGAPAALSFECITIPDLRQYWLEHHEQVLRSSVQTIARYRTATDHLLNFLQQRPVRYASHFRTSHAAEFVHYLRSLRVAPNGHAHTPKRPLMDKGLRYVLECCRALFNYAAKHRHLSPYADNPFAVLEIDRIPVEQARPITLFTPEQQQAFLEACDDWQFPLFLTLLLTGLRSGELCHLLLPEDLDLDSGMVHVRNKPHLGWQVKTRNERSVPLVPVLVDVLRCTIGDRRTGPAFRRRLWDRKDSALLCASQQELEQVLRERVAVREKETRPLSRTKRYRLAQQLWREAGALRAETIRLEFMQLTRRIGLPQCTAPKLLRHQFATALQEGRVDPLIRNELMGHVPAQERHAGHGLGMTAVYTHTRPETCRRQLEEALCQQPGLAVAAQRLRKLRRSSH